VVSPKNDQQRGTLLNFSPTDPLICANFGHVQTHAHITEKPYHASFIPKMLCFASLPGPTRDSSFPSHSVTPCTSHVAFPVVAWSRRFRASQMGFSCSFRVFTTSLSLVTQSCEVPGSSSFAQGWLDSPHPQRYFFILCRTQVVFSQRPLCSFSARNCIVLSDPTAPRGATLGLCFSPFWAFLSHVSFCPPRFDGLKASACPLYYLLKGF